jgi:hypothetical protein
VNRADRLRKVAPGASDEAVSALSSLPVDQVAVIAAFARQARKDALKHEADRKRQRKADDKANGNHDEDALTRRNLAVIASQGERAKRGDLDALTGLGQVRTHVDVVIGDAVEGCRAEGLSDKVIGDALGVTRAAIGQRYGRKGSFTLADQAG